MNEEKKNLIDNERDQDSVSDLLRFAERRPPLPQERAMRMKAAVHAHWRSTLHRSQTRKRFWFGSAVASAALIVLFVLITQTKQEIPSHRPIQIGKLQIVSGSIQIQRQENRNSRFTPAKAGDLLFIDNIIETRNGRAAIQIGNVVSLRMNSNTRIQFKSASMIHLMKGMVYLDSQDGPLFEIHTRYGNVRDIGTQFQASIDDDSLKVGIREGLVRLYRNDQWNEAGAGTEISIDSNGKVQQRSIPIYGADWDWVMSVAPSFQLDGATLESFLTWIKRENGWEIHFVNDDIKKSARDTILHGTLTGIRPDQAHAVVLPTCSVSYKFEGNVLILSRTK
jgi:hypothetical protein